MKRMIKANTDQNVIRFEVGDTYRASMLYGGYSYYKVTSRTANTVTIAESHFSEDDGERVNDGVKAYDIVICDLYNESYDEVIGEQEAVVIWEYKGHVGYLYAGQDN